MVLWYSPYLHDQSRFAANATHSLPTMKPEEFQLLFEARLGVFYPILGQLTNTDFTRLREELTAIFLPLP